MRPGAGLSVRQADAGGGVRDVAAADEAAEGAIMRLNREEENAAQGNAQRATPVRLEHEIVFEARKEIGTVTVSDPVEKYIVALVFATRYPDRYDKDLAKLLQVGVSPRGVIGLDKVSRSYAWLDGRDYVTPDDVKEIAPAVLRHRVTLTPEAEMEGTALEDVLDRIFGQVEVPR